MNLVIYTILLWIMYYMNYLGSSTTVLGKPTMELSTIFPFQYMPPGVTFMVAWTIIFVLLAVFLAVARRHYIKTKQTQSRVMLLFWATCITNSLWVIVTGRGWYRLSIILIALLMWQLYLILDIYKKRFLQKTVGRYTFGTYYGWVSIATCSISLSQAVYLIAPSVVLSNTWARIAVLIWVWVTLYSRKRWRNIAALVFALWGLGWALYSLLG